jgi:hypothetical protein
MFLKSCLSNAEDEMQDDKVVGASLSSLKYV